MATYRAVNSGTKGQMKPKLFEIKLHMVVALRAAAAGNKRHRQSFEEEGFLNLDDLIVHLFGDKCIALQMKHRQDVNKKKITSQELSQPKNDFSLWQLFLSYYSRKDDIEYIVAYTNGKFDSDMKKKTKSIQSDPDDPFQQLFGCTSESCEKFRQIDAPYHEEFLIDPKDGKWKGKGAFSPLFNQYQKEAKDTKEALKADFFKRLIFAISQTSEEECEREIRALLAKLCNISNDLIDPFYAMWHKQMTGWVGTLEDVPYITADSITSDLSKIEKACLSSLVSLSFLNELKCTKVKFCDKKREDCINMLKNLKCFGQNSERKHAVLRTSQVYAFTLLIASTIQKAARNFPSPLFLLKTKHQEKLTRLSGLGCVLLVHDSTQGNTLAETLKVLRQAQPEFSVIVLTNEDKDGPKEETEEEIVLDDIECNDLSDGTLKMVLDKKVLFQGKLLSMKEIVGDEVGLRQVLDPETIEKIVSDKNIHIGQSSVRSKEPYIERRLTRADKSTTENTTGPQIHDARRSETAGSVLSEDEAVQQALSTWSHVVVTAPPGTGKSTLVPSIATRLKDKRPQLWVGVCDLGDNLKVLGVYQDEIRKSTSNNTETSLSNLETKLLHDLFKISGRSELEQQVFDQALHGGNLVLLIDSYDEIDFKYGDSFLAFLSTLVSKKKAHVWTMTREPHVEPLLKALGQPVALSLQNLKKDEQIELLTELLTAKNLPGAREPSDIAKTFVLGKLRPGFAENPLHLKMVSEIIGETAENGMDSLSLSNLYDKFVRMKFDKYYKDFKHNPRFDEVKNYDEFENEHIQLSVLVLLEDGKRGTLEIKTKSNLDYIQERAKEKNFGLLRASDAGRPVFVHQTYMEYFLAVHLHNLLTPPAGSGKLDPKDLEMFHRVLTEFRFEVVREFLNDKLHKWFPTDTQMVCCSKDFRAEFFETNLILTIITESLSSLLKLLFELEKMVVKHAARGVLKHFVHRMDHGHMLWVWQGVGELVLRYMKDAALMEVAGLGMQGVRRMVAEALKKLSFPDDSHRLPFLAAAWCSTEGWDRNPRAVKKALAALKAAPAEDRAIVQGALCSWLKGLGKRPLCNDDFLQLVRKCGQALCPLLRKEVCEPAEKVLWIWLQDCKVMSNWERMDIDALQKQVSESPESFGFADEKEFGKRAKCCEGDRRYVRFWLRDGWAQASGRTHVLRMAKEALEVAESSGGLDNERTACLRSWIGDVEDVRFQDQGKLYIAIKWGEAEVVRQLLKAGVDLNVRFEGGRTFLHLACANGHGDIVRMLLGAGCDPNAKDDEGSTALHYSALSDGDHSDIVRMLLGAGCDATAQDDKGGTALHHSASNSHRHTTQMLIDILAASGHCDAPPQQPGDGEQALRQTAAGWRHPVYVEDKDGRTPLAAWAGSYRMGDERVPMLLLQCMKDSELMAKAQLGMQDVRRMVAEVLEKLRFLDDSHRLPFLAAAWCSTEGWDPQAVRQEALAALKAAPDDDRAVVLGALCPFLQDLSKWPLREGKQLVQKCRDALYALLRNEGCGPAERVLWIWLIDMRDLVHLAGGPIHVAARLAREAQPLAAAGSEENRVLEHWSRTRVTFESCFL